MDLASLILSAVAVLAAGLLAARQNSIQARILDLEHTRDAERHRDQTKARLVASVERGPGRYDRHLQIYNGGYGGARELRTFLDDAPISEHALVARDEQPMTLLGSEGKIEYLLMPDLQSEDVIKVRLEWTDDSREPGVWESHLRLT
jgi:hypothetical protein